MNPNGKSSVKSVTQNSTTIQADSENIIPIYITNVHPILINDAICWDIYYLTENSKEENMNDMIKSLEKTGDIRIVNKIRVM